MDSRNRKDNHEPLIELLKGDSPDNLVTSCSLTEDCSPLHARSLAAKRGRLKQSPRSRTSPAEPARITTAPEASGSRSITRSKGPDGTLKSPCTAPSGPCRTQRNGRCLHCLNERTKCEPLCQFCVSWHTLSWSVPAGMAEMAETCSQTKTEFMLIYKAFSRERLVLPDRIELSTSPLPMECSTTELRQHAGYGNRPKRPRRAGRSLPQGLLTRKRATGLQSP
jgi:hypothetical protein